MPNTFDHSANDFLDQVDEFSEVAEVVIQKAKNAFDGRLPKGASPEQMATGEILKAADQIKLLMERFDSMMDSLNMPKQFPSPGESESKAPVTRPPESEPNT